MGRKRKSSATKEISIPDEELERFAGSSDEEEEEPLPRPEQDADDEQSDSEESNDEIVVEEGKDDDDDDDSVEEPFVTNETAESIDPAEKMSAAISRILGTSAKNSTSAVLAKTVTPLQRLQNEEKKRMKELKEKRMAKKERNLAAFHIPLSVATSNKPRDGRLSLSKELARERIHRRVATRGVVALFNAIAQHQLPTESAAISAPSESGTSKMTKHSFLDKIKSSASKRRAVESAESVKKDKKESGAGQSKPAWNSLQDDYMMKSAQDWDEDSSGGEEGFSETRNESSKRQKIPVD